MAGIGKTKYEYYWECYDVALDVMKELSSKTRMVQAHIYAIRKVRSVFDPPLKSEEKKS